MPTDLESETAKERLLETYRSMISHSSAAVKLLALLNGGAVVALLAFLGKVWEETNRPDLALPMGAFAAGLVFAALAGCSSYLTQYFFYNELRTGVASGSAWKTHPFWLGIGIASAFLSLAAFTIGSVLGVSSIT